jgi:hypothetical protein
MSDTDFGHSANISVFNVGPPLAGWPSFFALIQTLAASRQAAALRKIIHVAFFDRHPEIF